MARYEDYPMTVQFRAVSFEEHDNNVTSGHWACRGCNTELTFPKGNAIMREELSACPNCDENDWKNMEPR